MNTPSELLYNTLKAKHRDTRDAFSNNDDSLRIHRALSWLELAENAYVSLVDAPTRDNHDAAFIFYWISFNAAYAHMTPNQLTITQRELFADYFKKITDHDRDSVVYDAIWEKFSGPIRNLLNNKYVFQPFWNYHNQISGSDDWEVKLKKQERKIKTALGKKDTGLILAILFERLYTLRNQLIHGGATWKGKVNRHQVQDGAHIMAFLVPLFIDLMMDLMVSDTEISWGAPFYPVIEE